MSALCVYRGYGLHAKHGIGAVVLLQIGQMFASTRSRAATISIQSEVRDATEVRSYE